METQICNNSENILTVKHDVALIIGNAGLGDSITLIGMTNYIATYYKHVFFSTTKKYYEIVKLFFTNPKIIAYAIDEHFGENFFTFDWSMRKYNEIYDVYDIYALGHFGSISIDTDTYCKKMSDGTKRKIIQNYPVSYYSDVNIPIEFMSKYFSVQYPTHISDLYKELLNTYPKYRVIHQNGSTGIINLLEQLCLDPEDMLTIDVNKNLYPDGHRYHNICEKFVNFPSIVYYAKLLENANELYLMDSCLHALGLVVDISKACPRICVKRTPVFDYGIPNKFQYLIIIYSTDDIKNGICATDITNKDE